MYGERILLLSSCFMCVYWREIIAMKFHPDILCHLMYRNEKSYVVPPRYGTCHAVCGKENAVKMWHVLCHVIVIRRHLQWKVTIACRYDVYHVVISDQSGYSTSNYIRIRTSTAATDTSTVSSTSAAGLSDGWVVAIAVIILVIVIIIIVIIVCCCCLRKKSSDRWVDLLLTWQVSRFTPYLTGEWLYSLPDRWVGLLLTWQVSRFSPYLTGE